MLKISFYEETFFMNLSLGARSFAIIGLATAAIFARPILTAASPTVDVAVKNWSFTPATIEARVGEPTALRFTSTEGVHGVESTQIGLAKTMIVPGKASEVSFTPKTAGTFAVHCAIVCGAGHEKMVMTVKVSP